MEPFVAPEPMTGELIEHWHRRCVDDLQRWANEVVSAEIARLRAAGHLPPPPEGAPR